MPRSTSWAVGAAAALLAGCTGAPIKTATPKGLAYQCGDRQAVIIFQDGGYLPDATVRAPDRDDADGDGDRTELTAAPRSTAKLQIDGKEHKLVAEWTEAGLRYRSAKTDEGAHWIWSARGETAWLGRRPAGAEPIDDEAARGDGLVACHRAGRDALPAATPDSRHDGPAEAAGEPHRR